MPTTNSRPSASEAHLGVSSLDCGGRFTATAAFWDEPTPGRHFSNLTLIVALGALSWAVPVAVIFWLVG